MAQKSPKLKPMIAALAESVVDDALAARDQFPGKKRKRLPRASYEKELTESAPPRPAKKKRKEP